MEKISNLQSMSSEEKKNRFKEKILAQKHELENLKDPEGSQVLKFIETLPDACVGSYLKARLKRASAKNSVKAQCQNCVGYEDMRNQIGGCQAYTCALYAYRPYQNKEILQ